MRSLVHRNPGPILAWLASVFAASAWAECPGVDAAALDWLDRMSRSAQELNYAGVAMLERGDELVTMQVAHRIADGSSDERLELLTGQGAVVVLARRSSGNSNST